MVKSLCLTLLYCPCITCIQEDWQYHRIVDFQLDVKLVSISLPDICTESSQCHNGFCNFEIDLIFNMFSAGERASKESEFINNFQFYWGLGLGAVRFSWLGPELLVCCLAHRGPTGVFLLLRS